MSILKELWSNVCSLAGYDPIEDPRSMTNLGNLKLVELKAVAKDRGLRGHSHLRKAELIRFLKESVNVLA